MSDTYKATLHEPPTVQAILLPQTQTGVPGPAGPQGPAGPAGPAGTPAPFAAILTYRADTASTQLSDPGTGLVRWNAVEPGSVTALYFDRLTADNNNDVISLWRMINPIKVIIQEASMATNQQYWVAAPMILYPDWFAIPVTPDPSRVTTFKPQHQTRLLVFLVQ